MLLRLITSYVGWKFQAPPINTQELERLLTTTTTNTTVTEQEQEESEDKGTVLLLDNRAEDEFAVSRIDGARNLDLAKAEQDPAQLREQIRSIVGGDLDKVDTVVCYCSVGYRSSIVANR